MNSILDNDEVKLERRLHDQTSGLASDMTLMEYFAAQALANAAICTGVCHEWELNAWFGDRCGITRQQIVAKQAQAYATAMIAVINENGI